jgi:formamidopyrimidine-DNA glycosylase
MPELPEVETVKTGLQSLIVGHTISSVDILNPGSFMGKKSQIVGSKVVSISRRGKSLNILLDNGMNIYTHLRMTGQLVYRSAEINFAAGHPNDSMVNDLPDRSTRVIIHFGDNSKLFFNDQRKFGWMKVLTNQELVNQPFLLSMGPEPLADGFIAYDFKSTLKNRKKANIKSILLDQKVVAGVGNIYADEVLFATGIHPTRPLSSVSSKDWSRIKNSLIEILNLSISLGGSTDRNYVDAKGQKGSYLQFAKVFRREGQECLVCGNTIKKIRVAGRGTHVCTVCQS